MKLLYIFKAIIRLDYWPKSFKCTQIINVPKAGKNLTTTTFWRPIKLLPTISKVHKIFIVNSINKDLNQHVWITGHQFCFCQGHSMIQQCSRLSNIIIKFIEIRQYFIEAFLYVKQAFDEIWHSSHYTESKEHSQKDIINFWITVISDLR